MRLLVTGASGFLGHHVLLRAPRDWDIVAVYHQTPGHAHNVRQHDLAHVQPVRCDLTSEEAVDALAHRVGVVDACLYLAANGDPARSAEHPAWDLQLNTLALVTFLERVPVGRLVYLSSGAVYDGLTGAVTPSSPVAPRLPYAISKLASEHYVRAFSERRRTLGGFVNVRFFGAYGPYEPPRKITTRWMHAVMGGQHEFAIRGDGQNLIDFMYVDEAVDALLTLTSAAGYSGTVDLASGAPISVNLVIETMARVLGATMTLKYEGQTEEYIQFRSTDPTMGERFGFHPRIALEDGVRRLHQFLAREGCGTGQPT